ncbi:MAG: DNA-formamidopyrimidine glycosylase, partial [Acidimicrobiia bacterium]|nr:DNA-formamidopyrimidine glycosylase [Acidimicrobiia bacterium]
LKAYGREGEPCYRCGTPLRRSVITQRSSFWCPRCQT